MKQPTEQGQNRRHMEPKTCNNECGDAWCCRTEFFRDVSRRWEGQGQNKVGQFKGIELFKVPGYPEGHILVRVSAVCEHLTGDNLCSIEKTRKPQCCKDFPVDIHDGIVLTERCVYYDPDKHLSYEKLEKITEE